MCHTTASCAQWCTKQKMLPSCLGRALPACHHCFITGIFQPSRLYPLRAQTHTCTQTWRMPNSYEVGNRSCSSHSSEGYQYSQQSQDWPGLGAWRSSQVDNRRGWGDKGPCEHILAPGVRQFDASWKGSLPGTLAECGQLVLSTPNPEEKAALTHRIWEAFEAGRIEGIGTVSN